MKGLARRLVFEPRQKVTRKWPISLVRRSNVVLYLMSSDWLKEEGKGEPPFGVLISTDQSGDWDLADALFFPRIWHQWLVAALSYYMLLLWFWLYNND